MTLVWLAGSVITGLAADTKPTNVPTNTRFIETDTQKQFLFNGTTWDAIGGKGMDNFYPLALYINQQTWAIGDSEYRMGFNRGDNLVWICHGTSIAQNGIKSLHKADDLTSYQNLTGKTVYAIVTANIDATPGNVCNYKLYSSPTNDSKTGATLLFDSATEFSYSWNGISVKATSKMVAVQPNHYLVIESTGATTQTINVPISGASDHYSLLVEPA